jgi:hypothetical protein
MLGMDYAANELEKVAKDLDEQSVLEIMPRDYDKRYDYISKDPKRKFQYNRERKRKQQVARNYKPDKLVPGSSGKK